MAKKKDPSRRQIAANRKARFHYEIGESFEAGIALTGTEVKSLRVGKATIAESYADPRQNEIWLINANIPEYLHANRFNHEPKRPRKLLLHRRRLSGAISVFQVISRNHIIGIQRTIDADRAVKQ